MSLITVTKAIRIDYKVLKKIEEVGSLMNDLAEELEEIAREDDFYNDLHESALNTSAHIETFLGMYAERNV